MVGNTETHNTQTLFASLTEVLQSLAIHLRSLAMMNVCTDRNTTMQTSIFSSAVQHRDRMMLRLEEVTVCAWWLLFGPEPAREEHIAIVLQCFYSSASTLREGLTAEKTGCCLCTWRCTLNTTEELRTAPRAESKVEDDRLDHQPQNQYLSSLWLGSDSNNGCKLSIVTWDSHIIETRG